MLLSRSHGEFRFERNGEVIVEGRGGRLVDVCWPRDGRAEVVATLERLRLAGSANVSGLRDVWFLPVPGAGVLVSWEKGLALLSPQGRLVWQTAQTDITATVPRIEGDVVKLIGDLGEQSFRLSDGTRSR